MPPKYNLEKIRFATDPPTYERAVDLYSSGNVTQFEEGPGSYSAIVLGTKPYHVSVEARRYGYGSCDCYLGQTDVLCKHMVAVAIYSILKGKKMEPEDERMVSEPMCGGILGELSKEELAEVKMNITSAMKYIKPYIGPSRLWFAYQNSLQEGCYRLSEIIFNLPVNRQTADLLIDMLLRLDKKLGQGGVDDSDGTVGDFIEKTAEVIEEYVYLDGSCLEAVESLKNKNTSFGWEEPLIMFIDRFNEQKREK
jgi:hypothetical protein